MNRAATAGVVTFLGCMPLAISVCLPLWMDGEQSTFVLAAATAPPSQPGIAQTLPELKIAEPVELGLLTLFELPEQRAAPKSPRVAAPFRLLAIEPELRSTIVSGHVFDGRTWRVSLRDVDRGIWDTIRPGESSRRMGVRLLDFREQVNGKPAATLEALGNGERWLATDQQQPSGRLLAVVLQADGTVMRVREGEAVADTLWRLGELNEQDGRASFNYLGGQQETLTMTMDTPAHPEKR